MLKKSTENKNHRSLSEYFFSIALHLLKYSKLSLHFRKKMLPFFRLKLVRDLHNLISSPTYNQTHRHLGDNRFLLVFPIKSFPLLRSKHRARSVPFVGESDPSSTEIDDTKTLSPTIIGVAADGPGSSTFHLTLLD